jgi:hypothetical protein
MADDDMSIYWLKNVFLLRTTLYKQPFYTTFCRLCTYGFVQISNSIRLDYIWIFFINMFVIFSCVFLLNNETGI